MSYFGTRYDLGETYGGGNDNAHFAVNPSSAGSGDAAAGGITTAAVAGPSMAPYTMGASFLLSYMKAKAEAFERKKQQEIQMLGEYGNNQEQAMNSLNNSWKSALLK